MATAQLDRFLRDLRRVALRHGGAGLTDGELLECFVSRRDQAAFAALVGRHGPMVWGVCRRVLANEADAEDAFQATFLVLVQKAAGIVPRARVGNWLYGVAHKTARKARAQNHRRQAKERLAGRSRRLPAADEMGPPVQALLDEELSRLPDKYRAPLVLCGLEGKTRKEAARQLGWAEGTVAGRLARARALLIQRLARRGLTVSSGALAAVLAPGVAPASVPAPLVTSTIQAATLIAAERATATAVISARVAALAKGVMQTMILAKVRMAAVLLLAVTVAGAGLEVVRHSTRAAGPAAPAKPDPAAGQRERPAPKDDPTVIQAVRDAGGTVHFFGGDKAGWVRQVEFLDGKGTDDGLTHLKGLRRLQSVTLRGGGFTDAGLAHLKDVKTIQRFGVVQCRLTDDGLAHLSGWKELDMLLLNDASITGEGFRHLAGLPVRDLLLHPRTFDDPIQLTDAGMKHLAGLPRLELLGLVSEQITDASLVHLQKLPRPRHLQLYGNGLSDAGLAHLKPLGKGPLQLLAVTSNQITDAGLEHLKDFPNLTGLVLGNAPITDAGLAHLRGLGKLATLRLDGSRITGAGLKQLHALAGKLANLGLSGTPLTDADLEQLKGLPQLSYLDLSKTKVTDTGLEHLKGLTDLRTLTLTGTDVTDAGVADLRKALPKVKVEQ